jgi:hypothetical protein
MIAVHLVTALPDRLRDGGALTGFGPDDDVLAGRSLLQPLLQMDVELMRGRPGCCTDPCGKQKRADRCGAPKAPRGDDSHC